MAAGNVEADEPAVTVFPVFPLQLQDETGIEAELEAMGEMPVSVRGKTLSHANPCYQVLLSPP